MAVMFISTVYCCFGVRFSALRLWTLEAATLLIDIFLSSFPAGVPASPAFPDPSADSFQKDRAVAVEQHPGGRLHHRHRLSVCVRQHSEWLVEGSPSGAYASGSTSTLPPQFTCSSPNLRTSIRDELNISLENVTFCHARLLNYSLDGHGWGGGGLICSFPEVPVPLTEVQKNP